MKEKTLYISQAAYFRDPSLAKVLEKPSLDAIFGISEDPPTAEDRAHRGIVSVQEITLQVASNDTLIEALQRQLEGEELDMVARHTKEKTDHANKKSQILGLEFMPANEEAEEPDAEDGEFTEV